MKTFTIGWLNKCRCGNKSHTVKTARGNESGLWDDDAVKCNSCGRGGVIQVCEGQARVLWETDEEMAEGKPMSTITKEQAQKIIDAADAVITTLAGTNEDVHPESDNMLHLWDALNDRWLKMLIQAKKSFALTGRVLKVLVSRYTPPRQRRYLCLMKTAFFHAHAAAAVLSLIMMTITSTGYLATLVEYQPTPHITQTRTQEISCVRYGIAAPLCFMVPMATLR